MTTNIFTVQWNEDGDATVLGRITARTGSGGATGVEGEGNWLLAADVSSIERKVFDLDGSTPDTPVITSLTVATSVVVATGTDNVIWVKDDVGYNFIDDIPASSFPTGGNRYRVEYKVTLAGGSVFHGIYEGQASSIKGS